MERRVIYKGGNFFFSFIMPGNTQFFFNYILRVVYFQNFWRDTQLLSQISSISRQPTFDIPVGYPIKGEVTKF